MITRFYDMSGGGKEKTPYSIIYIEGDEKEAVAIFYNQFGFGAYQVSCDCCGPDYQIVTYATIEDATGHKSEGVTVAEHLARPDIKFIQQGVPFQ